MNKVYHGLNPGVAPGPPCAPLRLAELLNPKAGPGWGRVSPSILSWVPSGLVGWEKLGGLEGRGWPMKTKWASSSSPTDRGPQQRRTFKEGEGQTQHHLSPCYMGAGEGYGTLEGTRESWSFPSIFIKKDFLFLATSRGHSNHRALILFLATRNN